MLEYKTYKLLNETLGFSALGLTQPQNLGLNVEGGLGGMPPAGPPAPGGDDMGMGDPTGGGDDPAADPAADDNKSPDDMDHDELVQALVALGHDENELQGKEEDELREMLKQEKGDDTDADLDADHDDDSTDDAGDNPHDDNLLPAKPSPIKAFMAKEGDEKRQAPGNKMPPPLPGEKNHKPLPGPGPQGKIKVPKHHVKMPTEAVKHGKDKLPDFLNKKCGEGDHKCKKCNDMKETASPYGRPKSYDPSEAAFARSIREQLSQTSVSKKYNDGMRDFKKEDFLIPPNPLEPQPGQPGYAPQARVGEPLGITAEAVADLMRRIEQLEKR